MLILFLQNIWYCNLKNTHNTEYFPIFNFFLLWLSQEIMT